MNEQNSAKLWSEKYPHLAGYEKFLSYPPVTGGFPSQNASNAEKVFIWWRHHGLCKLTLLKFRSGQGHFVYSSVPLSNFNIEN